MIGSSGIVTLARLELRENEVLQVIVLEAALAVGIELKYLKEKINQSAEGNLDADELCSFLC